MKVNKTSKHFSRNIHGARMFPHCFAVSHTGNIVSSVLFLFQDVDYTYATPQRILTKIRACEHMQKVCKHGQTSTHLIFASNSSKGKILRALSNSMEPVYNPNVDLLAVKAEAQLAPPLYSQMIHDLCVFC